MSHDLSLTRIHSSLDRVWRAGEPYWVLGSTTVLLRGETNFTETNVSADLRPTRHGPGAADYEWSLAIMGSWVT